MILLSRGLRLRRGWRECRDIQQRCSHRSGEQHQQARHSQYLRAILTFDRRVSNLFFGLRHDPAFVWWRAPFDQLTRATAGVSRETARRDRFMPRAGLLPRALQELLYEVGQVEGRSALHRRTLRERLQECS